MYFWGLGRIQPHFGPAELPDFIWTTGHKMAPKHQYYLTVGFRHVLCIQSPLVFKPSNGTFTQNAQCFMGCFQEGLLNSLLLLRSCQVPDCETYPQQWTRQCSTVIVTNEIFLAFFANLIPLHQTQPWLIIVEFSTAAPCHPGMFLLCDNSQSHTECR